MKPIGLCLFIASLATQLILIQCVDLKYDQYAAYANGNRKPCLNNCVNGQCIVDTSMTNVACTNTKEKALIYHLFRKNGTCLSRCITDSYSWCYIDNDQNWEYCNANTKVEWARNQYFTDENGPCKEQPKVYYCDRNQGCSYKCKTFKGGNDFVNPDFSYDYIYSRTQGGQKCLGRCTNYGGTTYNWCYGDRNQKWDYCALPAMPPVRSWNGVQEELFQSVRTPFSVKFTDDNCPPGTNKTNLNDMAKTIQDDQRYTTVLIHKNHNPVYKKVTESRDIGRESNVIIPRLVRAEIRPRHLRDAGDGRTPKKFDDNVALMGLQEWDRAYKLIQTSLSGPNEYYNYVPSFNRNLTSFASHSSYIRKFLTDNPDPKVDVIVVPMYRGEQTRLRGIAKYLRFYNRDELVESYFEYLPNSLLRHDKRDPESGPSTTVPNGAEKIANCIPPTS